MSTRLLMGWLVALAVAIVVVTPSAIRYRDAAAGLRDARASGSVAGRLRADVDTVVRALPSWTRLEPVQTDDPALAQKFAVLVTASGLPSSAVESFTPTRSGVISIVPGAKNGPTIVRARASAALTDVTLPQLGRLLETWRTSAPGWTVTQIDLTPLRLSPAEAARYAGADLPLRVGVSMERLSATGLSRLFLDPPLAPSTEPKDVPR